MRLDAISPNAPEFFQYLKYLGIICFALYLLSVKKNQLYFTFILLFLFLLIDDVTQLHQIVGRYFVEWINLKMTFKRKVYPVFGQIIYLLITLIIFSIVFITQFKFTSANNKKLLLSIFKFLGVFLFFGVFLDLIHTITSDYVFISKILTIIEEGGEMLSLSLIVWLFYLLTFKPEKTGGQSLLGFFHFKKKSEHVNMH
ncbi:hypothetical protein [Hyunsoonleella pacifica]|uniref:Transmembrane protein n=1 Tax=Hyunsoonleella pacifica TaxID=1080224 RepID=A0A4Q9FRE6_9FLAO|nr:hypothetical protein [Hyunsoonleella pacifica]TBN18638.1 hypothetical protein EYD46_00810 [Hyunsoonleella pacifica]